MSKLSEPMKAALRTGRDGEIVLCNLRTETALIRRGLIHPTQSHLTEKGIEALAELDAEEAQEELAERAVYRVEIKSVEPVTVDGESKYRDLYQVYRLGGMTPVDSWIKTEGEPDYYSDSAVQLAAHGWTLHGYITWDSTTRLYTGQVALDTAFQPVQETAAEPQPKVIREDVRYVVQVSRDKGQTWDSSMFSTYEWENLALSKAELLRNQPYNRDLYRVIEVRNGVQVEPQPQVVREDVKYVVQRSETEGVTWRSAITLPFTLKDQARVQADLYREQDPANLYRVVEIRETWNVV